MYHREMCICLGVVALYGDRYVAVAKRYQRSVSDPSVRPHLCSWRNVRLDERHQRLLLAIGYDLEPQSARNVSTLRTVMLPAL